MRTIVEDIVTTAGERMRRAAAFIVFVLGYCSLIAWFRFVDHYHSAFSSRGLSVATYNVLRVVFIFYLFAMVYGAGWFVLRAVFPHEFSALSASKRIAVGFFTGAGLWHALMLMLGFLELYTFWVAVAASIPAVILGSGGLRSVTREVLPKLGAIRPLEPNLLVTRFLATCCLLAGALLLLVKGLYPAGGHDYNTHYFYYYNSVIQHHGLWPNEVWYHFYYSKGAGLYFLSILLTDPLAPQLVTFCFFAISALALFHFVRRVSPDTAWAWVAVILYLSLFVYTPGQYEFREHGGWGQFEKLHELNASLVISILWFLTEAIETKGRSRLLWALAAASSIVAATVINVTIAAYLGSIIAIVMLAFLLRQNWALALTFIGLGLVAAFASSAIFAINYAATGLINDQGILLFWPLANIEKLYRWGALPLVIWLHWHFTDLLANSVPLLWQETLRFLALSLRLDLLWPLFAFGLLVGGTAAVRRAVPLFRLAAPLLVLSSALFIFLVLAVAAGRSQPISFFRYSSFVVPVTIATAILLSEAGLDELRRFVPVLRRDLIPIGAAIACVSASVSTYQAGKLSGLLSSAASFASGVYSIDNAYADERAWHSLPWGGIYPGSRGAYQVVGPNVPIWTFHIHTYCMLPDCWMEQHPAFILTGALDEVLFGRPEHARDVLKASGHNFFLFSKEIGLEKGLGVTDFLTRSPLFTPDNIGRYLGIRWTDGNTALLTWLGSDTVPLDSDWIASYRRAVQQSPAATSFPYGAMRQIYQQLHATPHPWRPLELRW